jgi:hypothetical protein
MPHLFDQEPLRDQLARISGENLPDLPLGGGQVNRGAVRARDKVRGEIEAEVGRLDEGRLSGSRRLDQRVCVQ